MKKYNSIFKYIFILFTAFILSACVHDDKYDQPDLEGFQCGELTSTLTIAQVKAKYTGNTPANSTYVFPDDSNDIIEGYVSSSDDTGNIYKYIYIQDSPTNPTEGFTLSVNSLSNYTKFPQGSKIYIKLNGLAVGVYGGVIQLGAVVGGVYGRMPEAKVASNILRSCDEKQEIVPKVMTLAQMVSANDKLLGCLIQVNDAEFTSAALCSAYAPAGLTVDRPIADPSTATTRIVRNSGYASFTNKILPAGKGKFVGIYSKFNTTYQMYIVRDTDLDMNTFPRKDGITANPCIFNPEGQTQKTVAEVKQLYTTGNFNQITGNFFVKAQVTANDETGNLYKYVYIEDATGGIKVNINKLNLYQDARFKLGKKVIIKLKDLYIGNNAGELQLGQPFSGNIGQIAELDVYKHFFDSNETAPVVPTERTIDQLTTADIGRWVKIKDLQFIDGDLGKTYANVGVTTNRTLEDCSGKKIILRTSNFADFGSQDRPMPSTSIEVDGGKGDVYSIVSVFNGVYQLWITKLPNIDLDNPRCDGTVPISYETIYADGFDTLANWTTVNVTGSQVWGTTNFGNPRPSAFMDGNRLANEDWLISKKVSLAGFKDAFFSFETDGRFNGNPLEVYVTDNYTGTVSTTTWTKINPFLDTDLVNYAGFVGSGKQSLNTFLNKEIVVAFKYTSVAGASTSWELDNFTVKGSK